MSIRITATGAPGTGKTIILNYLQRCLELARVGVANAMDVGDVEPTTLEHTIELYDINLPRVVRMRPVIQEAQAMRGNLEMLVRVLVSGLEPREPVIHMEIKAIGHTLTMEQAEELQLMLGQALCDVRRVTMRELRRRIDESGASVLDSLIGQQVSVQVGGDGNIKSIKPANFTPRVTHALRNDRISHVPPSRDYIGSAANAADTHRGKYVAGLRDGESCNHSGCLSHVSHPCEGCGRVGGVRSLSPVDPTKIGPDDAAN